MKKFLIVLLLFCFTLPSHAFFWNKKNKTLEKEMQGKGYAGTLPKLENKQENNRQKVNTPIFESVDNFNNPSDLKPVPKDNPAFINIIQKKDKAPEYMNDITEIIPMLEKLAECIDDNESIQLFITKANLLTLNIDNLNEKYNGKPEGYYQSFRKLQEINRYVKSLAKLRQEAVMYQRYLAYSASGSVYNPENINRQLQYLSEELNAAILILKEEKLFF